MKRTINYVKHMKLNKVWLVFVAGLLILAVVYTPFSLNDRKKYETFLNQHEYSQRQGLSVEDLKNIPKQDRPDLAWEQDFLMTMDPALGYPPVERLQAINEQVMLRKKLKAGIPGDGTYNWMERGPNNVAGRVRALMFDPNDATNKKVWAGGVAGGLWYNNDITDVNSSWNVIDDFWSNIAISSIAYDPSNSQIFYVGTGEGWGNVDAVDGGGIWKTVDGGFNWNLLASTNPISSADFGTVQKIVVASSGRIIVGTNKGILISDNGGSTWVKSYSGFIADVELGTGQVVYASKGKLYTDGAFLKSVSLGDSWTEFFPGITQQRIELAVAPSNPDIIYAVASDNSDISWFKKSTNAGVSWLDISIPMYLTQSCTESATDDFTRGQAWYDLILAVHPTNPDIVFVGGIDINKSDDGGSTWTTVTYWTEYCDPPYSHADQHAIAFRPGNDNELIVGSDGGVSYSSDAGSSTTPSFTVMNKGFNITQYYAGAMHPDALRNYFLGGSQDNGSHKFENIGVNSVTEVTGGDGAYCFIDQSNPDIQITSYTNNNYYFSSDGGKSFQYLQSADDGKFINPAAYDNNLHILYSAKNGTSLNRILNVDGKPEIGTVDISNLGSTASHIKVSPYTTNSSTIFVGTGSGRVFKVTHAEASSSSIQEITGASFPTGNISCIAIGASESELLLTFSNYGVSSVWYTDDGGTSWTEKEGNLPDMPVRWALFNPNDRTQVILATEVGVWSTDNISVSTPNWTSSVSGLANVRTDMLLLRASDNEVLAVTHGRGLFTSDAFSNIDKNVLAAYFSVNGATNVFPGSTINFEDLTTGAPSTWEWAFEGGTPATSTNQNPAIAYDIPGIYQVSLTVSDGTNSDTETKTAYIDVSESGGWSVQSTAFTTASRGIDYISIVDENIVWAQAFDGTNTDNKIKEFTKTIDGGQIWTPQTIDIPGDIYPAMIHAINADTAWIPMYPNASGAQGGIYFTADGGQTWTKQASATFTGDAAFANVVYFWNKDEGFCMGDPNDGYFEIYTTSDGGANWTRVAQANIPDPSATDEYGTVGQFCVADDGAVFFNTTKGRIYKSTDKGLTWTVITTPLTDRNRIAFADGNNGFIFLASNSLIAYYTEDGGDNWTRVNDSNLYSSFLEYIPGTERMYMSSSADTDKGAGVSYSIDGGKSWTKFEELDGVQCLAIGFSNMTKGWVGQFSESETQGGVLKYNGPSTIASFTVSPDDLVLENAVKFTDVSLSIEPVMTYSWDFGENASPATADTQGPHDVTYSVKGEKAVTLTVNGQSVTKEFSLYATGIDDDEVSYEFTVYPNPNNGQFKMKINSEKSSDIFMEVYSMNGQIVYFNRFNKGAGLAEFSVDLGAVNKGFYIVKVFDGESYQLKKIIVK